MARPHLSIAIALLAAALLGVSTSACSSQRAASTPAAPELSADVASWRLPLSSRWSKIKSESNLIAEDYWVARCTGGSVEREAALKAYLARQAPGPTWNADLRRLFTPRLAAAYGYRVSPTFASAEPNPNEAPAQAPPAWRTCFERLRHEFPLPQYAGTVQNVQLAAFSAARKSSRVRRTVTAWRDCFRGAAIREPATTPLDMPTDALVAELQIPKDLSGQPTPLEVEVARADARCRVSSGYLVAFHEVESAEQSSLLAQHARAVDEELRDFARYDDVMAALVGAN